MKVRDLKEALSKLGWWPLRKGGKHEVWTNGDRTVAVPHHREINERLALGILKQAKGG